MLHADRSVGQHMYPRHEAAHREYADAEVVGAPSASSIVIESLHELCDDGVFILVGNDHQIATLSYALCPGSCPCCTAGSEELAIHVMHPDSYTYECERATHAASKRLHNIPQRGGPQHRDGEQPRALHHAAPLRRTHRRYMYPTTTISVLRSAILAPLRPLLEGELVEAFLSTTAAAALAFW